jgi:hypothetical protein
MRRLKNEKTKKILIGAFLAFLMVSSIFAVVLSGLHNPFSGQSNGQTLEYNNIKFQLKNDQWTAEIRNSERSFFFHPQDLEFTNVDTKIKEAIIQTPDIFLVFNPNSTQIQFIDAARFEITQVLLLDFGKNVHHSVTSNTTLYDFPVLECESNPNQLYITFIQGNQSETDINDNCISIETSNPVEYLQYTEKIIYQLLDVIQ